MMPYGLITLNRVSSHRNYQTSSAACDRGSILLAALAVNAIILLVTISYFPYFQTVLRAPAFAYRQDQARQLAEAGISEALWELNKPGGPTWTADGWNNWPAVCGSPDCQIKLGASLRAGDGSNALLGEYTVGVQSTSSSNPIVTSTGFVPDFVTQSSVNTVRVVLRKTSSAGFNQAAFGAQALALRLDVLPVGTGRINIDSYDISPYVPPFGNTHAGDVGSNANLQIGVNPTGGATVDGKGLIGPTGTTSGPPPIGGFGTMPQDVACPAIQIPAAFNNVPTSMPYGFSTVIVSGTQILTCPANTKMRVTSLSLRDDAKMILEPGCEILIDGAASFGLALQNGTTVEARGNNKIYLSQSGFHIYTGGGVITTTQNPRDLQIYAYGPVTDTQEAFFRESHIEQKEPFYGAVYTQTGGLVLGPKFTSTGNPATTGYFYDANMFGSMVSCGTAEIYAVDGRTVNLHYDTRLRDVPLDGTNNEYRIQSWQTLTPSGSGM